MFKKIYKTSLLATTFGCLLPALAVAEASKEKKWQPKLELQAKAGNKRSLARFGGLVPLFQNDDSMVFADLRLMADNKKNYEGNFGIGYRTMALEDAAIWGFYGYFDRRHTKFGSRVNQLTVGVERLTDTWDARMNVYVPQQKKTTKTDIKIYGKGFARIDEAKTKTEVALRGLDMEIGRAIPGVEGLRLFAGGYYFKGSSGAKSIIGMQLRGRYDLNEMLSFETSISRDNVRKVNAYAGVKLSVALGDKTRAAKTLSPLAKRMTDEIIRDVDIVTNTIEAKPVIKETKDQVFVKVDDTVPALNPKAEQGTYENPYSQEQVFAVMQDKKGPRYKDIAEGRIQELSTANRVVKASDFDTWEKKLTAHKAAERLRLMAEKEARVKAIADAQQAVLKAQAQVDTAKDETAKAEANKELLTAKKTLAHLKASENLASLMNEEKALSKAIEDADAAEQTAEQLRQEVENLNSELQNTQALITQLTGNIGALDKAVKNKENALKFDNNSKEKYTQEANELNEKLQKLNLVVVEKEEALRQAEERNSGEDVIESARQEFETAKAEVNSLKTKAAKAERAASNAKNNEQTAFLESQEAIADLAKARSTLQATEKEATLLLLSIEETNSTLEAAKEQAKLLKEIADNLNNLKVKKENYATKMQRSFKEKKQYKQTLGKIVKMQSLIRGFAARKELTRLKAQKEAEQKRKQDPKKPSGGGDDETKGQS